MNLAFCSASGDFEPERRILYENACERVWPSVVKIDALSQAGSQHGSGFMFRPYGLVLTASHVVHDADTIMVTLGAGCRFGVKVMDDCKSDVAVIKIHEYNTAFALLGDSQVVQPDQPVVAISTLNVSCFQRIICAGKVVSIEVRSGTNLDQSAHSIWTDAPIIPGYSGSPLINSRGEVVGIINKMDSSGCGVAIPINTVKPLIKERLGEDANPPKIIRASIKGHAPHRGNTSQRNIVPPEEKAARPEEGKEDNADEVSLGGDAYVYVEELARGAEVWTHFVNRLVVTFIYAASKPNLDCQGLSKDTVCSAF